MGGAGATVSYKVRWRVKDTESSVQGDQPGAWNAEAGVDASGTSHMVSDLLDDTTYEVQVRALNGIDPGSAWSDAAQGTTPERVARVSLEVSPDPVPEDWIGSLSQRESVTVAEGRSVSVTVRLKQGSKAYRPPSGPVRIPVIVRRGTLERGDLDDWQWDPSGRWKEHVIHVSTSHGAVSSFGVHNIRTRADADRDNEVFTVALDTANLPVGYEVGEPSEVTVTLRDNEAKPPLPPVILEIGRNPVPEGEAVAVGVVLGSAPQTGPVTVPLRVTRGTSEPGDHGTLASLTVPVGHCCASGLVPTAADADGDDETFTVAVDAGHADFPAGYRTEARSSVEVRIVEPSNARLRALEMRAGN